MKSSAITVIVNGNTYHIDKSDAESIRQIPKVECQILLDALEAIKNQNAVNATKAASKPAVSLTFSDEDSARESAAVPINTEHMGSGDVDAMMARLIVEERINEKPGLTKPTLYKFVAGFTVIVILLIFFL